MHEIAERRKETIKIVVKALLVIQDCFPPPQKKMIVIMALLANSLTSVYSKCFTFSQTLPLLEATTEDDEEDECMPPLASARCLTQSFTGPEMVLVPGDGLKSEEKSDAIIQGETLHTGKIRTAPRLLGRAS